MNRIYLIDCPGVVYPTGNTETDTVLKGIVRVENLKSPMDFIPAVLDRVKHDYLKKTYAVESWNDSEDLLEQIARKTGRLFKKGEADVQTVARTILNDFQRGKLPYFVKPPESELIEKDGESTKPPVEVIQSFKDAPKTDAFDAEDAGKEEEEEAVVVAEEPEDPDDDDDDKPLRADPDVDDLITAKNRKFEEESKRETHKTTGRERRKMEKKDQMKKIGDHFYDKVDVKNRKRSKGGARKMEKLSSSKHKHQKRIWWFCTHLVSRFHFNCFLL